MTDLGCPCGLPNCSGWSAEVRPGGWFIWWVYLRHGPGVIDGHPVWGKERARRKAQKLIRKRIAERRREARETFVVDAQFESSSRLAGIDSPPEQG